MTTKFALTAPRVAIVVTCILGMFTVVEERTARAQSASTAEVAASGGRYCSATASLLFQACQHQTKDDFLVTMSKCINQSDEDAREECVAAAGEERRESTQLCRAQRVERLELCKDLGEARYDPSFDPADFESDYKNLRNPNPYFPLTIGYRWEYAGGDETNTIVALNETKLIEGVTCIVLNDKRYEKGKLVENTDDWYGQRKDGTVDFCGEMVGNYETFKGDRPARPELLSTDGQWKTGRDRDPSGAYFLGSPTVGDMHRQEFSPGNAEDTVVYLSTSYGYGTNPALDRHVPRDLVDLFCSARDCVVTGESTALEPDTFHHKFYARGVGFILEVSPKTGEALRLVGCNFDPRCKSLRPR